MAMRQGLTRLTALYGTLERMRSVELRIAAAALAEIEQAQVFEAQTADDMKHRGRAALISGSRVDWESTEIGRRVSEIRAERMMQMSSDRAKVRDQAAEAYQTSHLQMKQVEQIMEIAHRQAALTESRRVQAAADDRYASRREWTRRKVLWEATTRQNLERRTT